MICKDDFIDLLKSDANCDLIMKEHLLSSEVWLLKEKYPDEYYAQYDNLKLFFAEKLEINSSDVCIVGSAKLGFSLNPRNNFSNFHEEKSDIDLVVVSRKIFDNFWTLLLENFYTNSFFVSDYHMKSVFLRYVSFKPYHTSRLSSAFSQWDEKMGQIKREFYVEFLLSPKINYRIYRSWDAVYQYHNHGLEILRKELKHEHT